MILLALGCGEGPDPAPVGEVVGRTYTAPELGAAIEFGEGWQLALDPQHFRAGLPGTLLEARHGELVAVLTFHPVPALDLLDGAGALDLLPVFHPVAEEAPGYRLQRLPSCRGAVERRSGEWIHLAQRTSTGLLEWQAFGAEPDALRVLACEGTRLL